MLRNHFFSIIAKEKIEETYLFEIKMHKEHPVYAGHFPSQPVAPGVCLAQMIKEILETELNADLRMSESRNMKFMAVLNPNENENVLVDLKYQEKEGKYVVRAHCKNENTSFFKIDATYSK